jgi:type I restriction enzyme, S subunit
MRDVMAQFYDGPHATPPPASEGPVYLGIKNMTEDGHLDLTEIRHISEQDYAKWTRRVEPRGGDVIFTYEASLHRYAVIPEGFRGTLGRRVALLRPREDVVNTRFLLYLFISPQWRNTVQRRLNVGSTVDRLPLTDFPLFPIRVPPLSTQRKIAAILSAYDDLIENNNRRIQLLEQMAQRIYHEWFVDFRYPGHENIPLVESELGPIPLGWTVASLGQVCVRITDGAHHSPATTEAGMPMASVKDMTPRSLEMSTCRLIAAADYEALVRQDCRPRSRDVLVSKDGANFLKHVFPMFEDSLAVLLSSIAVLRPSAAISPVVLALTLRDPENKAQLKGFVSGAAIPRVVLKDFKRHRLVLPPRDIQELFEASGGMVMRHAVTLENSNRQLCATRDLLLPRLMSGEIDITDRNIAVPEESEKLNANAVA